MELPLKKQFFCGFPYLICKTQVVNLITLCNKSADKDNCIIHQFYELVTLKKSYLSIIIKFIIIFNLCAHVRIKFFKEIVLYLRT